MQPTEFDLTDVIEFIFARIGYAVVWAQTHSVRFHDYVFTFFDIFMGTATLTIILSYIPGWEDIASNIEVEEEEATEDASFTLDDFREVINKFDDDDD